MADLLDVRGLSCPIPLIKVRDALVKTNVVEVLVDDPVARANISKYAKSQGYHITERDLNRFETKLLIEKS